MKTGIIFITVLILFISCNQQQKDGSDASEMANVINIDSDDIVQLSAVQLKNAGIITGTPEKREMHSILKVDGIVEVPPRNIVSVSIPLGGYLERTGLIPGAKVAKGSVLARLQGQQYIQLQQDYLTAHSRLEYVSADYNRQKTLNQTKAVSDKVFQEAQTSYQEQKILVKSLSERLKLVGINPETLNENNISRSINIYSPVSGYVTKVNVNIGKYVNPEDVLFELINPDDLHLKLIVFEKDASKVATGQKILWSSNSSPEEKYTGTVRLITPNIREDRATEVHCELDDHHKDLFPGTFVNADIELNRSEVLAVPEESVVKWENKYHLFVEEDDRKFRLLPVETGASVDGYIEIASPLPDKKIIIKNAYTILMKMKNSGEEE